jgi:hypothetical protein
MVKKNDEGQNGKRYVIWSVSFGIVFLQVDEEKNVVSFQQDGHLANVQKKQNDGKCEIVLVFLLHDFESVNSRGIFLNDFFHLHYYCLIRPLLFYDDVFLF